MFAFNSLPIQISNSISKMRVCFTNHRCQTDWFLCKLTLICGVRILIFWTNGARTLYRFANVAFRRKSKQTSLDKVSTSRILSQMLFAWAISLLPRILNEVTFITAIFGYDKYIPLQLVVIHQIFYNRYFTTSCNMIVYWYQLFMRFLSQVTKIWWRPIISLTCKATTCAVKRR